MKEKPPREEHAALYETLSSVTWEQWQDGVFLRGKTPEEGDKIPTEDQWRVITMIRDRCLQEQ